MAKPSIFNSDYHRRLQKRKRNIIIAVILCSIIIIFLVFVPSIKSSFNKQNLNFTKIFNSSNTKKNSTNSVKKPVVISPKTSSNKKEEAY